MFILFNIFKEIGGLLRTVFLIIDSVGLTFIDEAYDLIIGAAGAFNDTEIAVLANEITGKCYVIIGIFALFRIALMLVNAIINPDKLNDKQEGYGSMISRLVITVVLFIAVPIVFDMSRELQNKIINNNYISKLILGKEINGNTSDNPGKQMRDIVVRTLITPDTEYLSTIDSNGNYVPKNDDCSDKCKEILEKYNNKDKELNYLRLVPMITEYEKVDDVNVYVLDYKVLIPLIIGGVITWILLNFAIDIALRSVELIALEILSPLFIVTYIDPKQGSKGAFSNWLKACGKTYLSLFIRIGVLCLMLLLISKVNTLFNIATGPDGLFLQLLMIIAILIFAGKAPKWLCDLLGVEGGIGTLGIGKKLKEGFSPYNNRATRTAAAVGAAVIGNGIYNARKKHQMKKATGDYDNLGRLKKDKRKELEENGFKRNGEYVRDKDGNIIKGRKAVSMYKRANQISAGQNFGRTMTGVGNAIISGIKVGKDAKGIGTATIDGSKMSSNYNKKYTGLGPGVVENARDKITDKKNDVISYLYGTDSQRYKQQEDLEKRRKATAMTSGSDYGIQEPGIGQGKVIVGAGDTKKVCDFMTQQNIPVTNDNFRAVQYAINQGYAKVEMEADNKTIKSINLQDCIKFDSENKPMVMKDGQMVIDSKGLSVNLGGIMSSNGDGIQIQEKLVNGYQTTSINNYEKNEQNLAQYASQNQAANETSNKLSVKLDGLEIGLKESLSSLSNLAALGLQLDSLDNISKSIIVASENIDKRLAKIQDDNSEEAEKERKELNGIKEQIKVYEDTERTKNSYDSIAQTTLESMEQLSKTQETLKKAFVGVGKPESTIADKVNILNIQAGDLDKYLNRNKKDEK